MEFLLLYMEFWVLTKEDVGFSRSRKNHLEFPAILVVGQGIFKGFNTRTAGVGG